MRFLTTVQMIVMSVFLFTAAAYFAVQGVYDSLDQLAGHIVQQSAAQTDADAQRDLQQQLIVLRSFGEQRMLWLAVSIGVVITLLLLALWVFYKSVSLPLQQLKHGINQIAHGELGQRLVFDSHYNAFRDIANSVNRIAINLEAAQAELAEYAMRDQVTGLYSKKEFFRRLHEESARHHRYGSGVSLVFLHIDQFDDICGMYGHDAGKVLAKSIAATISGQIRSMDCFGRIGEADYGLVLPETPRDGALVVTERIRDSFTQAGIMIMQGHTVNISLSASISAYPEDAKTEEQLIETARKSLALASSSSGNQIAVADRLV